MTNKEIQDKITALKKKKAALLFEVEDYQKKHGSEFFKPLVYQQKIIDYMWEGKKRLLLQGANQIGKTLTGAALVDSWCRGIQAWDGRQSFFEGRPTLGRIICTDWEYHADKVIVPKLKEIIPYGSYKTTKNKQGTEAFWDFPNGSSFHLMTIKQDTQSHESATLHWVWQDEPGPQDKYTASCRALIRHGGIFLISMTAVGKEAWMLDKIALNTAETYGCVTRVPMRANTYLTEENILRFIADCDPLEVPARVYGDWLQLTGMVIKGFDKDKHMVDPFEIPPTWPVIPFIDIHLNKKQAVSFFTWDRYNREFQIDEIWEHLSPEKIADEIIKYKKDNRWNITECGIDPLAKGDSAYLKNRYGDVPDTFTIIEEILDAEGIELFAASKDKASGIRNINSMLVGVNTLPVLYFFKGKTKKTIFQLQRWIYDENGVPLKKDDDFPENLYRSTLLDSDSTNQKQAQQRSRTKKEIADQMDFADYVDKNTGGSFSQAGWQG
jgi:hypothetical protein